MSNAKDHVLPGSTALGVLSSNCTCTLRMTPVSHATPDNMMLPSTVAPAFGVVIEMNGATVSNVFALFVPLLYGTTYAGDAVGIVMAALVGVGLVVACVLVVVFVLGAVSLVVESTVVVAALVVAVLS